MILLIVCFVQTNFAQGTTTTPYDTTGWSPPAGYSTWYRFYIYTLMTNPGGRINLNTVKMDSLFHALIVYTDTTQLVIKDDTLMISNHASGIGSFSGTAQYDTTLVPTLKSTDVVTVTVKDSIPTANDIISVRLLAGKIIVQRPASGTANLAYYWAWRKRY